MIYARLLFHSYRASSASLPSRPLVPQRSGPGWQINGISLNNSEKSHDGAKPDAGNQAQMEESGERLALSKHRLLIREGSNIAAWGTPRLHWPQSRSDLLLEVRFELLIGVLRQERTEPPAGGTTASVCEGTAKDLAYCNPPGTFITMEVTFKTDNAKNASPGFDLMALVARILTFLCLNGSNVIPCNPVITEQQRLDFTTNHIHPSAAEDFHNNQFIVPSGFHKIVAEELKTFGLGQSFLCCYNTLRK